MDSVIILPAILGFISVLQGGLNLRIAARLGLINATMLNNTVLLVATLALCFFLRGKSEPFLGMLPGKGQAGRLMIWYLVPGILGLSLVMGIPFAIFRLGTLRVFVMLIATQILGSALWDFAFEAQSITAMRALGAVLSVLGAVLVSF